MSSKQTVDGPGFWDSLLGFWDVRAPQKNPPYEGPIVTPCHSRSRETEMAGGSPHHYQLYRWNELGA